MNHLSARSSRFMSHGSCNFGALLRDSIRFPVSSAISAEANGRVNLEFLEISPEAHHRFVFDASSFHL